MLPRDSACKYFVNLSVIFCPHTWAFHFFSNINDTINIFLDHCFSIAYFLMVIHMHIDSLFIQKFLWITYFMPGVGT